MKVTLTLLVLLISNFSETMINDGRNKSFSFQTKTQFIENDFKVYWSNLGKAFLDEDFKKLDQYLHYSVTFYGREDKDPIFKLEKKERIIKVLTVFNTGGYYDYLLDESISYKDFFNSNNSFEKDYRENSDIQEIKDFTFKKIKGCWKLTSVCINTK
jgi:hypothetical protein